MAMPALAVHAFAVCDGQYFATHSSDVRQTSGTLITARRVMLASIFDSGLPKPRSKIEFAAATRAAGGAFLFSIISTSAFIAVTEWARATSLTSATTLGRHIDPDHLMMNYDNIIAFPAAAA